MSFRFESKAEKTCPKCGAAMKDCALCWMCPICRTFVDMKGGVHLHEEKPFMPPRTLFDEVTKNPETLADYIASEVLGLTGVMYQTSAAAWRKVLMQPSKEE